MCWSLWMVVQLIITIVVICVLVAIAEKVATLFSRHFGEFGVLLLAIIKIIIVGAILIWLVVQVYYMAVCMGAWGRIH